MATVSQMLALRAICAVILFRQTLAIVTCENSLSNIENCWRQWFPKFEAPCNGTGRVVRCAEIQEGKMEDCHFLLQMEALHRRQTYERATEVACNDKFLQKEVPKHEKCWIKTRECADPLIFLPKREKESNCTQVIKLIDDCTSMAKETDPECVKIINTFLDQFIETTVCGAINLSMSTVLVLAISSLLTLTSA